MNSAKAKSAINEAPVPPPRTLPGMNPSLVRIATRLARHAGPLLLANQALLLSMTADTQDNRARLSTCFWDTRCTLALPRSMLRDRALQRHLAALETAAHLLLEDLIGRWPANAIPPALGILTDGGGVAFSSDHPSPLSPDWLAHHQAGLCPTTTLLPFNPNSAWMRLMAPTTVTGLH